jgi:hypothetical protein
MPILRRVSAGMSCAGGYALLDDHIVDIRTVTFTTVNIIGREAAHDGVIMNDCAGVISAPRLIVNHVNTPK